jgi:hypothetical protein
MPVNPADQVADQSTNTTLAERQHLGKGVLEEREQAFLPVTPVLVVAAQRVPQLALLERLTLAEAEAEVE